MKMKRAFPGQRIRFDLAAIASGEAFLVVEVKAMHGVAAMAGEWLTRILLGLREHGGFCDMRFGMVVDLDEILVFDNRDFEPTVPVCRFETRAILEAFDPEFAHKRIFDDYLLGLVEAWLRELGWEYGTAPRPGLEVFDEIGLAKPLAESSIYREVILANTFLVR